MKPVKCLHQHDFKGKSYVVCLVTLKLLTQLPESTPPIRLHHFLYYCGLKPQFQRQIELSIQQCPCQPTHSRQTSNLVLEELLKGMVQHKMSTSTRFGERKPDFLKQLWIVKGVTALQALSIMIKAVKIEIVVTFIEINR
ncbi:hypothetical protein TNCV_813651 [Trichonephila clavipes]|nr:hypothetical protein TNCV_813651 [Trichonephila clavipes]